MFFHFYLSVNPPDHEKGKGVYAYLSDLSYRSSNSHFPFSFQHIIDQNKKITDLEKMQKDFENSVKDKKKSVKCPFVLALFYDENAQEKNRFQLFSLRLMVRFLKIHIRLTY